MLNLTGKKQDSGRRPRKILVGSSSTAAVTAAAAEESEALNKTEYKRPIREKTPAEKAAHAATCRKSRRKMKTKRQEKDAQFLKLQAQFSELQRGFNEMRAQNQWLNGELGQTKHRLQYVEREYKALREAYEQQKQQIERMKQSPSDWNFKERSFRNIEEAEAYTLSQSYKPVDQKTGFLNDADKAIADNPTLYQSDWDNIVNQATMGFVNTSTTASAAGPSVTRFN